MDSIREEKDVGSICLDPSQDGDSNQDIRYGLRWEEDLFGPIPVWTVVPDINVVTELCQRLVIEHLPQCQTQDIQVKELGQGAFNRIYRVEAKIRSSSSSKDQASIADFGVVKVHDFAFRVSLPVNPQLKTISEVATLAYLKKHTTIPVPTVITLNASTSEDNPLRFEYMLQTFMPGNTLEEMFYHLGHAGRSRVVQQIANFQSEIFRLQHDKIGSLYETPCVPLGSDPANSSFRTGKMATTIFFLRERLKDDKVGRGPFSSTEDWLEAQLALILHESIILLEKFQKHERRDFEILPIRRNLDKTQVVFDSQIAQMDNTAEKTDIQADEHGLNAHSKHASESIDNQNDDNEDTGDDESYDLDDIENTMDLVQRLLDILPSFFSQHVESCTEQTILFHHDLSFRNILVDEEGTITAILDWENTACLPLWAACDFPHFLRAEPWHSLPDPNEYDRGEEEDMYQERLMRYHLCEMRDIFLSEMKAKCPLWAKSYENGRAQRDFLRAVEYCDEGLAYGRIYQWLDAYMDGGQPKDPDAYVPLEL